MLPKTQSDYEPSTASQHSDQWGVAMGSGLWVHPGARLGVKTEETHRTSLSQRGAKVSSVLQGGPVISLCMSSMTGIEGGVRCRRVSTLVSTSLPTKNFQIPGVLHFRPQCGVRLRGWELHPGHSAKGGEVTLLLASVVNWSVASDSRNRNMRCTEQGEIVAGDVVVKTYSCLRARWSRVPPKRRRAYVSGDI